MVRDLGRRRRERQSAESPARSRQSDRDAGILPPKSARRNPMLERNPKSETRIAGGAELPLELGLRASFGFRISGFGLLSDFGFRISDFQQELFSTSRKTSKCLGAGGPPL